MSVEVTTLRHCRLWETMIDISLIAALLHFSGEIQVSDTRELVGEVQTLAGEFEATYDSTKVEYTEAIARFARKHLRERFPVNKLDKAVPNCVCIWSAGVRPDKDSDVTGWFIVPWDWAANTVRRSNGMSLEDWLDGCTSDAAKSMYYLAEIEGVIISQG